MQYKFVPYLLELSSRQVDDSIVQGLIAMQGNDEVFEFLESVLIEVIDLFPSKFIHIGGDEVCSAYASQTSDVIAPIAHMRGRRKVLGPSS